MQNKVTPQLGILSCLLAAFILVFANALVLSSDIHNESKMTDGLASWWLAKAYLRKQRPPDVVILGGSQLGPLLAADAYTYNRVVDITDDHRSHVLERDLAALLEKPLEVFICALPGSIISDQLVISHALFGQRFKPRLVALTFSPRDFIDNNFPIATSTETSTFFSKYTDPSLLRENLSKARKQKYTAKFTHEYQTENAPALILGEPFERISAGELTISHSDNYSYRDNTDEYKQRYRNPLSPQLETQMGQFDSLLKYLAQLQIKVVAFNLPLKADNKKLLPDTFWKCYDGRISEICRKNGADYVSVDKVVLPFKDNEFIDGVHLNLAGGHRLSKTIALFIANKLGPKTFQELLARDKYLE